MGGGRRGEQMQGWVRVAIAGSVVVAPFLIHGIAALWFDEPNTSYRRPPGGVPRYLPSIGVSALLFLCLAPRGRVSRWVRAAVLVPMIHIGAIALAWVLWRSYTPRTEFVAEILATRVPLVHAFPLQWVLAIGLGATAVVTWIAARHRVPPAWFGSVVGILVVHLLLLGVWLPIVASVWPEAPLQAPADFIWITAGVPMVVAIGLGFAVLARGHAVRESILIPLLMVGVLAVVCRLDANTERGMAYANGLPLLLVEAVIALAAVVALGAVHWRSLRRARRDTERAGPWLQRGVVEGPEPAVVGALRFPSWLHGLRPELQPFLLRTGHGVLEVPIGSRLVVPIPASTAAMKSGDVTPIVRVGDRVVVTGYVPPPDRGPYRTSAKPIPGDDGLVVTIEGARSPAWRDLLLTIWRPCVLYLIAAACVAIPAIAGLAAQ